MRIILITLLTLILIPLAAANEPTLFHAKVDVSNKEKLQRGARFFMNYCSGCHSLKYLRYNRMGQDLGLVSFDGDLDEGLLYNNLIFTEAKAQDPIEISMPEADARQWFGQVPPDLSLSARQRGTDWIYTYLKSFYADPTRPFGANNLLIPQVAMPNVLEPLAGKVVAVANPNKNEEAPLTLIKVSHGQMSAEELDSHLQDLVTFLAYVGEPAQLVRYRLGFFVIAFLVVFFLVVYPLKKIYWRRIK